MLGSWLIKYRIFLDICGIWDFLKFVIFGYFFSHSIWMFTYARNFVFFFLKEGPKNCVSFRPHNTWICPCVFDKRRDNCCSHDRFTWRVFVANDSYCPRSHARTITCLLHTLLDLTSKQTLPTPLTLTTFTDRWSIFVQVYRSGDMAGVYKWLMFVVMYFAICGKAASY